MSKLVKVNGTFYNIRGSFKVKGLDIGAHTSLVKRKSGKWLLLDSLKLEEDVKAQIDELTDGGTLIEAVLNLHPFHTKSCEWAHSAFPTAAHYGTSRHKSKFPNLPWQEGVLEEPAVMALFKEDLDLRIPAGVDFVSQDESIHFSSIVAYHPASRTIHSDDTFMYIPLPGVMGIFGVKQGSVKLHPMLKGALEKRQGATRDFRLWMRGVMQDWAAAENLCAAHVGALLGKNNKGNRIVARLEAAVVGKEKVLSAHEKIHH